MLYQSYQNTKSLMQPVVNLAEIFSKFFANPVFATKYPTVLRYAAAWCETVYRIGKDYHKPEFNIDEVVIKDVAYEVNEYQAKSLPFCNLIHFKVDCPSERPTVLLVAPLSGHHATLLRDTVKSLLVDHDVYITDWLDARLVPVDKGDFTLASYVEYVQDFIRFLGSDTHVMAICQPCVPVVGAVSLMASNNEDVLPKSLILVAGPVDTRVSPTKVNDYAVQNPIDWFESNVIYTVPVDYPGFGRPVYPGFLQHAAFISMNPENHRKSHLEFYKNLCEGETELADAHRKFYDEYNAVLDMSADFYLDTIETVFQKYSLPKGEWIVNGRLVRPQDVTGVRLLTIEGEKDDICGRGQTEAAHQLFSGIEDKHHYLAPGCGHYGVFSGKRWRGDICPKITEFIKNAETN